jgi:uncharacterized DUF497 family protein
MRYEWNDNKRVANRVKHGVDFADAERFDWQTAVEARDDRSQYGEERFVTLGFIDKRLHVLIYTSRRQKIRLISLRRANKREKEFYEKTKT